MADPTTGKPALEEIMDRPFTKPQDEEGIGPTLGEDVGAGRQREEDARHGAHDVLDGEDEED